MTDPDGTQNGSRAHASLDSPRVIPDPGMAEAVELFLRDLPGRLDELVASWYDGEHEQVRSRAHLLAGSAMMYQLPAIAQAARALEMTLTSGQTIKVHGAAARRLDELIEACQGMLAEV